MANVSHATVSLALRNQPQVAAKTRERIQQLARSCGYRPDPMLRSLAEYRRDKSKPSYQATLAWLSYFQDPSKADAVIDFLHHRLGAEARAEELGYKLEVIAPVRDRINPKQVTRILQARGIQGILLPPLPQPGALLDFDFTPFSILTFGFSLTSPALNLVANDQYMASWTAFRKLREMGHQRVGFVTSSGQGVRTNWKFAGGYLGGQAGLPLAEQLPLFITPENNLTINGMQRLLSWKKAHRPDAIITHFPEIFGHMNDHGISVPEDVSVAMLPAVARESWAGVDLNSTEVGRTAIDVLASMLYHNETGVPEKPKHTLIQPRWKDGVTVIARSTANSPR